jgi:hypothetical protein
MKIINLGREILLLGSVRESIMTPSQTSGEIVIYLTSSCVILAFFGMSGPV